MTSISAANAETVGLYPNPTSEQITLEGIPNNSTIDIYDNQGRLVNSFMSHHHTMVINCSHLNVGLYHVNIANENTYFNEKFCINR